MIKLDDIKWEDKNAEVQLLEMALAQVGLGLHYAHTELLIDVIKKLKEKGGDFNLEDGTTLKHGWEDKWRRYFEKQEARARLNATLDAVSEPNDSST